MSIWEKIKLTVKLLFGGFEAATDYLLKHLNDYLAEDGVKDKAEKVCSTLRWFSDKLIDYRCFCPMKWNDDYNRVIECVSQLAYSLEDGKVTKEEVSKCHQYFSAVYTEWMKED